MGKIKKILENELVGGTQTTDIYPVTSIKAVYDENNERLDHILEASQEKLTELDSLSTRIDANEITLVGEKMIPNNWVAGYYTRDGNIQTDVAKGFHSTISVSQYAGSYITIRTGTWGVGYCVFFDSNGDFIQDSALRISELNPLTKDKYYIKNVLVPNNAVTLGITNFIPNLGLLQNSEVFVFITDPNDVVNAKINTITNFSLKSGQDNLLPFISISSELVKGYYLDETGIPQRFDAGNYIYLPIPANTDSLYFEAFQPSFWQVGILAKLVNGEYEFVADLGGIVTTGTKNFSNYISQATHIGLNVRSSWIYTEPDFDGLYRTIRFTKSDLYKENRTYGHCLNKPFDLHNKTFTFFGDSITWGYSSTPSGQIEDCWAKLFTDHFGSTKDNRAISGTKICDVSNSSSSITNRILNYSETPDFIFIHGGTNDYGNQTPLGNYGDSDYTTFYGSMELICQHLSGTNFVNTTVIFITPINRSNGPVSTEIYNLNQYRNAMWEIAAKYGFNIIDGSVLGFPNRSEASSVIRTLLLTDGLHPSNVGHSFMAKCIAGILD